jgi:molybdopterin-guanine dinucleotide biosynthesis protein A
MGQAKASIHMKDGRSMLRVVCDAVASVSRQVVLLGSPTDLPDDCGPLPVWPDAGPSRGPLSGLATLLHNSPPGWCLIVACDMPLITEATLNALLGFDETRGAVLFEDSKSSRLHTCCAAYHTAILETVLDTLAGPQSSLQSLISLLPNPRVLKPTPDQQTALTNINTPDDLRRLGITP